MFQMNAGYFLIQLASEKDKERVYKLIGENIRKDANGVKQVAFIGVINPQNPRVETPEEVCADLMLASKYIPERAVGFDRRLRIFAVQHRCEAKARLSRCGPRRRLPEDRQPHPGRGNGVGSAGGLRLL